MKHRLVNKISRYYQKNGFVVMKNLLDNRTKSQLIHYVNQIEQDTTDNKYLNQYELSNDNKPVLCRTEYIINHHLGMKQFLTQGMIPNIVSRVSGFPIHLYKEKINYKYPNTGGYRPHQDITAYPNSMNHTTCLIHLCDTNLDNGCLQFSPIYNNSILENTNGILSKPQNLSWVNCPTNFGDVVLFNSYIPHKSGPNKSNNPRKSLYITYNHANEGNLRDDYYQNKLKNIEDNKISLIDHYDGNIVSKKKQIVEEIIQLYQCQGNKNYDLHINHLQHALQTTQLSKNNGDSESFQLSCFLHDIGHLLLDENNKNPDFLKKDLKHETIGFNYLKKYFDLSITKPIMFHVLAKRYLCSIDQNYYQNLSQASKKSFLIQGGYLDNQLQQNLENNSLFINAVQLRKYEDYSKNNNIDISIDLHYIRKLLNQFITI